MKLRLSVFALVVFVIFLLSWVIVANAQDSGDPFPWIFGSGQETVEYEIEINRELTEESYILLILSIGSEENAVPFEFEPSLQQGTQRFAAEINVLLQKLESGELFIVQIPVTSLQLKDPEFGMLDPETLFDPNDGPVSIGLVHAWDPQGEMGMQVLAFGVFDEPVQIILQGHIIALEP